MGNGNQRNKVRQNKDLPRTTNALVGRQVAQIDDNVCIIHSIYRGLSLNGESSNACRRYVRKTRKKMSVRVYSLQRNWYISPIIFSEEVACPH